MVKKCPIPKMSELHDSMVAHPHAWLAGITGVCTAGYYAVPDFINSKIARFAVKSALMATQVVAYIHAEKYETNITTPDIGQDVAQWLEAAGESDGEIDDDQVDPADDSSDQLHSDESANNDEGISSPLPLAAAIAVVAGGIGLGILGEKWLYRRAERRRTEGVAYPHTKQGVIIGLLNAAATLGLGVLESKTDTFETADDASVGV